jgi:Predicted transcriptional regulator
MNLSKSEEQLMEFIWRGKRVYMKELLEMYPNPKPAYTTVATLLKRMQEKGVISYKLYGNSREYYPLIKKSDYFSNHVSGLIKNFFNNSPLQFASFFTSETNLSSEELEEIRNYIDTELQKKKI